MYINHSRLSAGYTSYTYRYQTVLKKQGTMKNIYLLTILILSFILNSCGQKDEKNYDGYTDLEIETEECLDKMFEKKRADFNELKTIFENYFSTGQITNPNEPIEKQYEDILSFWERPTKQFPIFTEKNKVVAIKEKLGLTEQDILKKVQLDCFTNNYIENRTEIDTLSSYYAFGASLETIREIPNISPGLIAGAIKMSMDKEDLKKELYQKSIVIMFCFDMTLYLTDGKE